MNIISVIFLEKCHLFILLLVVCAQASFAQGFKIREFKQNMSDGSAFQAPSDANGHTCGLIKVRTDNTELQFKGSVVGDVENKTNEYWVYMAQGSNHLTILHPNFLPMTIDFSVYGIREVDSKATYVMTLDETKYNKKKCGLVATVKPEAATLYIDNILIDNLSGNGLYQIYLPKGDHICRIEQKGYRPVVQVITTGKENQLLNVELESVMAELEVKCKMETAEIYVDGVLKGNGIWKGMVLAGKHQIEARQKNFNTNIQTIYVEEKENHCIVIPALTRMKDTIVIDTEPTGIPVLVDGEMQGRSPVRLELETGVHIIICNPNGQYGCETLRQNFDIKEGNNQYNFLLNHYENEDYQNAYAGDVETIIKLACERYWCGVEFFDEALFWASRIPNVESFYKEVKFDGTNNSHTLVLLCEPDKMAAILRSEEQKEPNDMWKKDLYGFGSRLSQEYEYLGDSYKMRGEYEKAIECYRKVWQDHRYESIGDCYLLKGNVQEAIKQYKMCLRGNISDYTKSKVEKKLKEIEQ